MALLSVREQRKTKTNSRLFKRAYRVDPTGNGREQKNSRSSSFRVSPGQPISYERQTRFYSNTMA